MAAGAPPEGTRVHHLGIRPETIPFRHRAFSAPIRFLSVGLLTEKKGIGIALQALARPRGSQPALDWHHDIIGDGELRGSLETLARQRVLTDRVTFWGPPRGAVREAMAGADGLLRPSNPAATGDRQGIPIVLMDAMSAGLLVVSTHHSGIPELVRDGETAILTDEGNPEDLARAVARLSGTPETLQQLTDTARRIVETDFHAKRQARETVRLIEEPAGGRDRPV